MHTKDARAKGETEQRLFAVAAWHEAPFFSPAERAAFALTDALTKLAGNPLPDAVVAEAKEQLGAEGLAAATWIIVTINAWNRVAIASHTKAGIRAGRVSAAALRALHVAGRPAGPAQRLGRRHRPARRAGRLSGRRDDQQRRGRGARLRGRRQTPVEEMLAAVARIARAVDCP